MNAMMFGPKRLTLAFALFGLGCQTVLTDIGSEVGDDESSSTEGESSTSGDEQGSDTQGEEQDPQLVAASGIGIVEIEANQGVQIPLTAGTDWIGPESRNARLVSGRETLIRAHWEVTDGWQPHPVIFRMHLGELILDQQLLVSGDSARGSLDGTANWLLPADESVVGAEFEIELLELDSDHDGELGELGSAAPSSGLELIGYEASAMEFEIVFVPVHYTGEGLDTQPDLTAETLAPLLDRLYELNPVTQVKWSVREPYAVSSELFNLGELLGPLASLRLQDGAAPQVYYHAFVDPGCVSEDCTLGGTSGIAMLATDAMASARVSAGTLFDVDSATDTTIHELAHVQGLAHTPCPTTEAPGVDPSYPYPDGSTGVWGYGLRSGALHDPASASSFMSYCPNPWASDWEWNQLFERIELLSAW